MHSALSRLTIAPSHSTNSRIKFLTRHLQQPPLVKQLLIARLVYVGVCDVVQKQRNFEMSVEPPKRKETTSSQTKKVDFEDHSRGFRPQITSPPPFCGGSWLKFTPPSQGQFLWHLGQGFRGGIQLLTSSDMGHGSHISPVKWQWQSSQISWSLGGSSTTSYLLSICHLPSCLAQVEGSFRWGCRGRNISKRLWRLPAALAFFLVAAVWRWKSVDSSMPDSGTGG